MTMALRKERPRLGELHARDAAMSSQRVGPLATLPDLLREFRVDPALVLADFGLPPDALDSAERRIDFGIVGPLLAAAATRTGCEEFGLLWGQRLGLSHVGTVGQVARHADSVGEAIAAVAVHHHLNSRGSLMFLTTSGAHATIGYAIYHANTAGADYLADAMAVYVLNGMRELIAPEWVPDEILLARRRPASTALYRRALPARLEFDAEFTGMRFSASILERPVPGAQRNRYVVFERQLAAAGRHSLIDDLRRALRTAMIRGDSASDRVAQMLDLHRRTLHRRLTEHGTTFRRVLEEVRYDTARHLLQLTEMPLVEIAQSLGYADDTAFARAFRRWSGMSPGNYRKYQSGRSRESAESG